MQEYDVREQEFEQFDELLRARKYAGLTQAEAAERMAAQPSVVGRLEAGGGRHLHFPSIATLRKTLTPLAMMDGYDEIVVHGGFLLAVESSLTQFCGGNRHATN